MASAAGAYGKPGVVPDPRFANRTEMNNLYADELDGYLEEWLGNFSKAELLARR